MSSVEAFTRIKIKLSIHFLTVNQQIKINLQQGFIIKKMLIFWSLNLNNKSNSKVILFCHSSQLQTVLQLAAFLLEVEWLVSCDLFTSQLFNTDIMKVTHSIRHSVVTKTANVQLIACKCALTPTAIANQLIRFQHYLLTQLD